MTDSEAEFAPGSLADRASKGRFWDEFVEVSGFHRKHAIRLLRKDSRMGPGTTAVGKRVYDEAVRQALIVVWEAADRICGKRLKRPSSPVS